MRFSHFVVGATALAVVARADEGEKPKNFEDVIGINKHLTKFRDTLSQSAGDLYSLISLTPGLTVLAPSNAAYDKLTFSPLKAVFDANDTAGIRNILQYHILDGVHSKKDFHTTPQFPLTFLTDLAVEKVKDGQKVEAVGQNGGGLVFISGLGGRTSVQEAVRVIPHGATHTHTRTSDLLTHTYLSTKGSPLLQWNHPSHRQLLGPTSAPVQHVHRVQRLGDGGSGHQSQAKPRIRHHARPDHLCAKQRRLSTNR